MQGSHSRSQWHSGFSSSLRYTTSPTSPGNGAEAYKLLQATTILLVELFLFSTPQTLYGLNNLEKVGRILPQKFLLSSTQKSFAGDFCRCPELSKISVCHPCVSKNVFWLAHFLWGKLPTPCSLHYTHCFMLLFPSVKEKLKKNPPNLKYFHFENTKDFFLCYKI